MTSEGEFPICYLCGLPMLPEERKNRDHIPMDGLLAPELRRTPETPITLITRRVHESCNSSYKLDEEYFLGNLALFGQGSVAGDAAYRKLLAGFRSDERKRPLVYQVMKQATNTTSGGVLLPSSLVNFRVDRVRFNRVVSKIIRGLYFVETETVLQPDIEMEARLFMPGTEIPAEWANLLALKLDDQGHHQGVFAYRSYRDGPIHLWLLLIWDRLIIGAMYEAPEGTAAG